MSRKYTSVRYTLHSAVSCLPRTSVCLQKGGGVCLLLWLSEKCRIMQQRSRLEDDSEAQRHRCMTRQNGSLSLPLPLYLYLCLPLCRLPLPFPFPWSVQNQLELFLRPERAIKIRKFDYCLRPRFTQAQSSQFPVPTGHQSRRQPWGHESFAYYHTQPKFHYPNSKRSRCLNEFITSFTVLQFYSI